MNRTFQVALTADFLSDGKLVYQDIGLSILERAGIPYRFLDHHEPVISSQQLKDTEALICLTPQVKAESLQGVEDRLLAILRFGVGYDSIDVDACTKADVALFITRGAVNHSVAEAIMGWMLALGHHMIRKDRLTREGRWAERSSWMGSELRGKVVGIIGLGGIGSHLVRLLRPFNVAEVLTYDPYADADSARSLSVRLTSLSELLRKSDYVVVCCPLSKETRNLLSCEELRQMKPTAYLVNAARGGIVNEDALVEALQSGTIAGAAIDVFAQEPVGANHPLCQFENVILAPHSIAWTHELFAEIGRTCGEQAAALGHGEIPPGVVNREVLERKGFGRKLERFRQDEKRETKKEK